MVRPTLGSRMANEQNRTVCEKMLTSAFGYALLSYCRVFFFDVKPFLQDDAENVPLVRIVPSVVRGSVVRHL